MTTLLTDRSLDQLDALPPEIAALLPEDAPELVGVSWVAELLELEHGTILYAIRKGKIPALAIPGARGTISAHVVRPRDAVRLWGPMVLRRRARAAAKSAAENES
ncbi:hypothetical protein [Mycobacterium avium]|uniref:hypothetical protein n=1 Tax=Mycobacterium avium TaxID=1764 RepID=UPI000408C0DE|nr:hypothetical protein [Mycobacterium avium]